MFFWLTQSRAKLFWCKQSPGEVHVLIHCLFKVVMSLKTSKGRKGWSRVTWGHLRRYDWSRSIRWRCGKDSWSVFLMQPASEGLPRWQAPHPTSSWLDSWKGYFCILCKSENFASQKQSLCSNFTTISLLYTATFQTATLSILALGLRSLSRSCFSSCFWDGFGLRFSTGDWIHGNVVSGSCSCIIWYMMYWYLNF